MAELALVEGWVELELLGHRRHQGYLSVRRFVPEQGSPIVLQLDAPAVEGKPAERHFYTPQAVYGIHPTTEAAVLEALTPWRPPEECGAKFHGRTLGPDVDDTCLLPVGHEGDHEGLPF